MRFILQSILATVLFFQFIQPGGAATTFTAIDPATVPASRIDQDFDPPQAAIMRQAFKKYLAITKEHGGQIDRAWLPSVTARARNGQIVDARQIFIYANAVQALLVGRGDSVTNPKYQTKAINIGAITPSHHVRRVALEAPVAPPTPLAPPTLAPQPAPPSSLPPPPPPNIRMTPFPAVSPIACSSTATPPPSVEEAWQNVSELSSGKNETGGSLDRCALPFEKQLTAAENGTPSSQALSTPLVLTIPISPFSGQSWGQKHFGAVLTNKLQFVSGPLGTPVRYGLIMASCINATAFSHSTPVLTVISSASSGASTTGIATPAPQNACNSQPTPSPSNEAQMPAANSGSLPPSDAKANVSGATSVYLGPIGAGSKPIVDVSSHVNPDYNFAVVPRKDIDLIPPFSASYGPFSFDVHLLGEIDVAGSVHSESAGGYLDLKPTTKVYITGLFGIGNRILGTVLSGDLTAVDAGGDIGAIAAIIPDATATQWNSAKFNSAPLVLIAYAHGSAIVNNVMSGSLVLKLEVVGFAPTIAKTSWPGVLSAPISVAWSTPWTVIYLASPSTASSTPDTSPATPNPK